MKINLTKTNLSSAKVKEQLDWHEEEYSFVEPTYSILSHKEEEKLHLELWNKEGEINGIQFSFPVFGLWKILSIESVEHANLISAIHVNFNSELEESFLITEFDEVDIPEKYRINRTEDFQVYATYPFMRAIRITIKPIEVKWVKTNRHIKYFTIGYILWQVIKVYKDIFLYHQKEVGNIGHSFGQLALGSFSLIEKNTGYIDFQS